MDSSTEIQSLNKTTNAIHSQDTVTSIRNINTNAARSPEVTHRVKEFKCQLDDLGQHLSVVFTALLLVLLPPAAVDSIKINVSVSGESNSKSTK